MDKRHTKSEAGKIGAQKSLAIIAALRDQRIKLYFEQPNHCTGCQSVLDYKKRDQKFCSHSCSANVSNINRGGTRKVIRSCKVCGKHTSNYKYCSNACQGLERTTLNVERWLSGGPKPARLKNFLLEEQKYSCLMCGQTTEWNGRSLSLQFDHIDGNRQNNRRDNLRLLCPNCHSQTETYAWKNAMRKNKNWSSWSQRIGRVSSKHEIAGLNPAEDPNMI